MQSTNLLTRDSLSGGSVLCTLGDKLKNWTSSTSGILILVVILAIIIISIYTIYTVFANNKPLFAANRENVPVVANSNKTATLMIFSVDWCPHCKTALPEWEELKAEYEDKTVNGYTVVFQEYNCTNENAEIEKLMDKYKIEGYPTVKLIKDNQVIEYDAKPTKATMSTFLNTVL